MNAVGIFGKLPAHGDFVSRHLPSNFISVWDEWLQCSVAGSRELAGEGWLDDYLTSPMWRFALRSGVVNESAWVGVLVPSVDSVGRYFPLTITIPVGSSINLFDYMASNGHVFEMLEAAALSTLQDQLDVDQLVNLLEGQAAALSSDEISGVTVHRQGRVMIGGCSEASRYAVLLQKQFNDAKSYSLWMTGETVNAPATTFIADGLPTVHEYTSMLNGYWAE